MAGFMSGLVCVNNHWLDAHQSTYTEGGTMSQAKIGTIQNLRTLIQQTIDLKQFTTDRKRLKTIDLGSLHHFRHKDGMVSNIATDIQTNSACGRDPADNFELLALIELSTKPEPLDIVLRISEEQAKILTKIIKSADLSIKD
jgi:hypothetical protein